MRNLLKISLILLLSSCGGIPGPKPPDPPEPTPEPCMPEIPWCNEVGQQCSSDESPCKHNPSSDPNHCELAPPCPPEPPPFPEPQCNMFMNRGGVLELLDEDCDCYVENDYIACPEPPEPPSGDCPTDYTDYKVNLVLLRQKPNGVRIFHINPKVKRGNAFSPILPEGHPDRQKCEIELMGGCPTWKGICYSQDPTPGACPITFDSDLGGVPWPANEACPWPPSATAPQVFISTPEGRGSVYVEDAHGKVSNRKDVNQ